MKYLKVLLVNLLYLVWQTSHSQPIKFSAEKGPEVFINNIRLANPWAGGLNSPQISKCNLNNDGIPDLFVFDRLGDRPLTFLGKRENGQLGFLHAPWYEQQLPEMYSWAQMQDYNCDGIEDLYISSSYGMQAFTAMGTGSNFNFAAQSLYVSTKGFGGSPVNLQVNYTDVPSIKDMDGDGDLDVLSVTFGGSTLEYNQNISKDSLGVCDNKFKKTSACWGGVFLAITCGAFNFGACRLPAPDTMIIRQNDGNKSINRPLHQGTSIHLTDLNGDNALDLIIGDIGCTTLYALLNQGTTANPSFNSTQPAFPLATPAQFFSFLSANTIDVDGDGDRDLIVIPNIEKNENHLTNLQASCWLYLNTGTNQNPNYVFQQQNWLQESMLDLGEQANPAFADIDADGDQDLIIGHAVRRQNLNYSSSLWLFENIGNAAQAQFALRDTNWLNLKTTGHLYLKPVFADLNGDGATDLLYTASSSTQNTFIARYILNTATVGQPFNLSSGNWLTPNFTLSPLDAPLFLDLTGDGLQDMLVGKATGGIALYQNTGTNAVPNYSLVNSRWGGISVAFGYTTCLAVADLNQDNKPDLVMGDQTGILRVVSDVQAVGINGIAATDSSVMRDLQTGLFNSWRLGKHASPAIADLDGDNYPDLLVGVKGGGINYLKNVTVSPLAVRSEGHKNRTLELYPNPAKTALTILTSNISSIEIYSATGTKILNMDTNNQEETRLDNIQNLNLKSGLYYVLGYREDQSICTNKFMVE